MAKVKYMTKVKKIEQLDAQKVQSLQEVEKKFVFRSNDYYNSLIDWDNPDDPLRKLVIPHEEELSSWGELDASGEESYTQAKGLEHKYSDTALILFNNVCGAYCRYCFRKRLFMNDNDDTVTDMSEAIEYIKQHPEISNVLITGGDPLVASTKKIRPLVESLRAIDHVKIIRFGTKMTAFNPHRFLEDASLFEMIEEFSTDEKKIYFMNHFTHPNELTKDAIKALHKLMQAGAICTNQTPMLKGINDDIDALKQMFETLSEIGVPPYYIFGVRPTLGNEPYTMPIETISEIFEKARVQTSGLAGRARFVMSHKSGKIEVLGTTKEHIMFRYHRAAKEEDRGKVMVYKRDPNALWFDDYTELVQEYKLS
ncbi:MAG: KamA family radical SAM protein [Campylobacterota bacterium]